MTMSERCFTNRAPAWPFPQGMTVPGSGTGIVGIDDHSPRWGKRVTTARETVLR